MSFPSSPAAVIAAGAGFLLVMAALLLTLPGAEPRQRPSRAQIDWPEALFLAVAGAVVLTGWLGVVLASAGAFSLLALAAGLLGFAGLLFWVKRPARLPDFARPGLHELGLAVLLAGCCVVYLRPHEYVLGGSDAGTYLHIGASVAQTGDFVLHDDWMPLLREHAGVTLRRQPAAWKTEYLQFVGWYLDDEVPSRVIPQFFPFHPTLIAVGVSAGGLAGGLMVTPLWGVLGIAAVFFLARALFGRNVALLAAVLLALTPTHIYFARYPTTEPLTLLLVFAGLLAFQHLWDNPAPEPIWGLLAGATMGVAFLTRIDLPILALLLVLAALVRRQQKRWSKAWTVFSLVLGLLLVHAVFSALLINWPYTWNTYSSVLVALTGSPAAFFVAGLGAGFVAIMLALGRKRLQSFAGNRRFAQRLQPARVRGFLAVLVIMLSAYAYFLRPVLEPPGSYRTWPAGTEALLLNGQNWVRLGWYLTPLGLLLATLGLAWLMWNGGFGRLWFFLAMGVTTTIQYVYNIFNTPYHIYAMRRYVPIVMPMLVIYAAVALVALLRARPAWIGRLGGAMLVIALLAGLAYQSRFVLPLREFSGAAAQLTALHERLQEDAIVVISEPAESIFADSFGAPLRFIFGHDIATIRRNDAGAQQFIAGLEAYALAEGRPLQLIAVEPIPRVVRESLDLQPREMLPVSLDLLMSTFEDYPSTVQTAYYGIEIYDIGRGDAESEAAEPLLIDVGTMDTAYIGSGFYYKEPLAGPVTMRWTTGEAIIDLPAIWEGNVVVDIRAMTYLPDGTPPQEVIVSLDGERLGSFEPETGNWRTYSFAGRLVPAGGLSTLTFATPTFNPAALGLSADNRDLGILIDWVKVTVE